MARVSWWSSRLGYHGASEGGSTREVRIERAASLVDGEFPARVQQPTPHARAVVLKLQVAKRVPKRS